MISRIVKRIPWQNNRFALRLIVIYMILTVIPMSLLGYLSYYEYTQSIVEQVGEYIPRILEQANTNIDRQIKQFNSLPNLIFESNDVVSVLRKNFYTNQADLFQDQFLVNNFLSRTYLNASHPDILGVFLLSNNRLFYSSKTPYTGFDLNHNPIPYGQNLDLRGQPKIILPNKTDLKFEGNPPFLLFVTQLTDTDNRKNLGTLFIAVQLSFLDTIMKDIRKDKKADMWVMDPQGTIIDHTTPKSIGTIFKKIENYPIFNGTFEESEHGEHTIISVSQSTQTDWILVHSINLKYVTGKTDLVRNVIVFVFLIIVVIAVFVSALLVWNFTRPLNKLSKVMKDVEQGNFAVNFQIHSKDEIGQLSKSFNSMITEIRELIQKNYQFEIRQKEAEMLALQAQINPHFMYNTLETIGMAVEEGETDMVVHMVTLLGRMLRFSLSNKDEFVPVYQEIQHVKDYLTIQKYRFENRLDFEILLEEIESRSCYTPKFILQPIVENTVKYGLDDQLGNCITIRVKRVYDMQSERESIEFHICDNGPGIEEIRLDEIRDKLHSDPIARRESGFGLQNVHARISMMFGDSYGLQIHSVKGEGTEVIICIPFLTVTEIEEIERGRGLGHDTANQNRNCG